MPQNFEKSTQNPLEIRFSDNVFFERVLKSILLRFSVAPNLKSSVFTKEKQCFLRNLYFQTKRKKCLFSKYFDSKSCWRCYDHRTVVVIVALAVVMVMVMDMMMILIMIMPRY